jgi:hypothetical protein
MPTKKDYFELLSFEQQDKYKSEYVRQNNKPSFEEFLEDRCFSIKQFLSSGFVFDLSQEGYFYWYNLANENLCLPNWVNVYYNDVDMQNPKIWIIKKDCKHFRLPNNFADAIAEDLLLNNLISNYIVMRDESKNIFFEADLI